MKFFLILVLFVGVAHTQTSSPADSSALAILAKKMMTTGRSWSFTAESYAQSLVIEFKKYMPHVPDSVWATFDQSVLVDKYYDYQVPILLKYFTEDDFVAIIAWNSSLTGSKFNAVVSTVYVEMAEAGQRYSNEMAKEIMSILNSKGYEYSGESK